MTRIDTSELTIDEKAALTSGADFWTTKQIAGIPAVLLTDGPHGVRLQAESADHLGVGASVPATCFPPAVGLAQSWDPELVRLVGVALGEECRAVGVGVLLGPGVNIKRSPLGGRNFEYYSEDPLLAGALATEWVRGLQSQGVGASLKHFALNNAETDRMRSSSDVDPRALNEIYLRAFERVVKDAEPWTVMCSYNKVNGVLASQNRTLLTDILRDRWGFGGVVVSDWGAVADRVAAVAAGLDLAMPSSGDASDGELAEAVRRGELPEAELDQAAARVAALAERSESSRRSGASYDRDAHHELAREAAARSIVLLANDGDVLPLAPSGSLAVIGVFAEEPRYQGGGSSHVNPTRVDIPLEEIRARAADVRYARGFTLDGSGSDPSLVAEAVEAARDADAVVLFLGLAASQESEGFDRATIELPVEQLELAAAVAAVNPRTVAVLAHGGVVRLAHLVGVVPAILDGGLLGQGGGHALAATLFGEINPSGRLAETVPARLQDTPAYLSFPGEHEHVLYGESIFVGYRWFDARELEVGFPFGHGLSYTSFAYSGLRLESADDGIAATLTVANTGARAGREIVQLYAGLPDSAVTRAPRQLAGFTTVELEPGESREATIRVRREDLAYWDTRIDDFVVEGGTYHVWAGASSRDLRLTGSIELGGDRLKLPLTLDSTFAEVAADPIAGPIIAQQASSMLGGGTDVGSGAEGGALGVDLAQLLGSIPIGRIATFSGGQVTREQLQQLLDAANAAAPA